MQPVNRQSISQSTVNAIARPSTDRSMLSVDRLIDDTRNRRPAPRSSWGPGQRTTRQPRRPTRLRLSGRDASPAVSRPPEQMNMETNLPPERPADYARLAPNAPPGPAAKGEKPPLFTQPGVIQSTNGWAWFLGNRACDIARQPASHLPLRLGSSRPPAAPLPPSSEPASHRAPPRSSPRGRVRGGILPSPPPGLLGVGVDVLDRLPDGLNLLRFLVRYRDVKLFLKLHHEFHRIQRISA